MKRLEDQIKICIWFASELLSEQGKWNLALVQQICSCPFPESPPCQSALSPLRAISNTQDVCLSAGSPHLFCLLLSVVLRYPHKMQTNAFSGHFVHLVPTEFACVLGLSYKSVLFVLINHKAAIVVVVSCSDKSIYIYFATLMFAWETFILSHLWSKEL